MPTLNIAHRGGAGLLPENTLAAFESAGAAGCDGVELDVQLSADGVVVVHHDYRLNPALTREGGAWLAGKTPRIRDLSFAALQAFDVGRADPASAYARAHPHLRAADGARIPALAQVIEQARPPLLFLELKSGAGPDSPDPVALADAALTVVLDHDYLARTIFVGFDWRGLLRIRKVVPQARLWFTTDRLEGDVRPVLDAVVAHGGDGWFAHFENATAENTVEARARGLKMGAWTVNAAGDMTRLIGQGLDALCTDRPDLLKALE